jgi:hypothetical protein
LILTHRPFPIPVQNEGGALYLSYRRGASRVSLPLTCLRMRRYSSLKLVRGKGFHMRHLTPNPSPLTGSGYD